MTHQTTTERHIPVLLHEVIENLAIQPSDIVVDGTLGAGGHAQAVLKILDDRGVFIGIDQDKTQLAHTQEFLQQQSYPSTQHYVHDNFRNITTVAEQLGIAAIDKALFDLGVSSMQLDTPSYGMSFQHDAPLSMVMNREGAIVTAFDAVNEWQEETLADIIYAFGDERYARRIARQIVQARKEQSIRTTHDLVQVIEQAVPYSYRRGKTHCATKTFQALRIAVNDEYNAIKEGLTNAINLLNTHGRIAVITFHSGEDRIVKHLFKNTAHEGSIRVLTKKPITPSESEITSNKRSRSAKLRVIEKI